MAAKLVILVLQLLPLAIWGLRRIRVGPRANFSDLPGTKKQLIQNKAGSAEIREQCTKTGWPIEAWAQIEVQHSRHFELAPQSSKRFSSELQIGLPGFDEIFFVALESTHFARELEARRDLRMHLTLLPIRLERYQAKLIRVACEGHHLAIQCNVRWTKMRPSLYLTLLVWMQDFDALLANAPRPLQATGSGVLGQ